MESINTSEILATVLSFVTTHGLRIAAALLVLIIGLWLIGKFTNGCAALFEKRLSDITLAKFLSGAINILLKVMLVISVASMAGIQTTSFIAILGAAGLAVGMALQGSLSNFAGGVMLLIFRPIKVGDYIAAHGYEGTVLDIGIFVTTLETFDKRHIIMPNGPLSNGDLVNYSSSPVRAIEITFGIAYDDDMKAAKQALQQLIDNDERVLKDEANVIGVSELGDSSVNIFFRAFVNGSDYWAFFFDANEQGKLALEAAGCTIPFPQRDVHIFQES